MTKVCLECGREFEPNPFVGARQKYCSGECCARAGRKAQDRRAKAARLAARANRVCKRCGKIFTPKNSAGVYCSQECRRATISERLSAEHAAARGTRKCPVCGKEFAPKSSRGVYCSKDCYNKAYGRDHKVELPEPVKCQVCGKEFQPKTSRARYCSRRCNETAVRRRRGIKPLATKTCLACGRSFETRGHRQLYCPDCKVKSATTSPLNRAAPFKGLKRSDLSAEKVSAYLALPAAERWARRGTLSQAELKMAEKMWNQMHSLRMV